MNTLNAEFNKQHIQRLGTIFISRFELCTHPEGGGGRTLIVYSEEANEPKKYSDGCRNI